MSNEADAVVSTIIAKWCAGFATLDAAALSSLYSNNAFFFGSNPKLYRGRDGVADYFNGLPRWRCRTCCGDWASRSRAPSPTGSGSCA
jgi:ketosteroid isomerase-like protein